MYEFRIVEQDKIAWDKIESCYDHTVYKSQVWLEFLNKTQAIKPFVVEISFKDQLLGYFVGQIFKKIFKIVASPFEGWTTSYQGLSFISPISVRERVAIYEELISYLFTNKICSMFQATDWQLETEAIKDSNLNYELLKGYKIDLNQTEEQIFKNFSSSSCQYAIKKSHKLGVEIREAKDLSQFAQHYYNQLLEVFGTQGLKPTYSINRVISLIDKLHQSGKLLLLEAVSTDGICLATGIFPGDNNIAFFWGGASYKKYQKYCPNEPIMYEAIKYWKNYGAAEFEFGGGSKYKEKYGPIPYVKPKIIASKYKGMLFLKSMAKKTFYSSREVKSRIEKTLRSYLLKLR